MITFFRQWLFHQEGSTAVEFALISLPFIYLLIGIIEMSLMFGSMSVIQGAANDASRLVRTGQVQQSTSDPEELFRTRLCEKASMLLDCEKLQYEVIELDSFASFDSFAAQYDEDGNLISRGFTPGGVNSVNLVRVSYRYQLLTPLIGQLLSDGPNNTRLLLATIVLQTEPYDIQEVVGNT
jgi:Flp pilus assembly protein TadG